MQFAIDSNKKRIAPTPKGTGLCPGCKNEVISKCGNVNIWHWSHRKNESCDIFSEPETYWHRNWKEIFGHENSEVIIKKDDKWHFADILTNSGVIIELQNSPLKYESIVEREEFYGPKMLWLLNSNRYGKYFSIKDLGYFPSPSPLYEVGLSVEYDQNKNIRFLIVDFQKEKCSSALDTFLKSLGFIYSPTKKIFYKRGGLPNDLFFKMKNILLEFSKAVNWNLDIFGKEYQFNKDWPARSWKTAKRPIFIDYHLGVLMRITQGMGEKEGTVRFYQTDKFIEKYKGE